MIEKEGVVKSVQEIQHGIFILKVESPKIAAEAKPGQFCNIKVDFF